MRVDHVLVGVADLDAAARVLREEHGLASTEGGRHPGWGTANRIVPLGAAYLELVAVVDPDTATAAPFGRWVTAMAGGHRLGWAARTDDIDADAARLGLPVSGGGRTSRSGDRLTWRTAGIERAAAEPSLPFLIEWGAGSAHPGTAGVTHPAGVVTLTGLTVTGDAVALADWLGGEPVPVEVSPGRPEVTGVVLLVDGGTVRLTAADLTGPEASDEPR